MKLEPGDLICYSYARQRVGIVLGSLSKYDDELFHKVFWFDCGTSLIALTGDIEIVQKASKDL